MIHKNKYLKTFRVTIQIDYDGKSEEKVFQAKRKANEEQAMIGLKAYLKQKYNYTNLRLIHIEEENHLGNFFKDNFGVDFFK